MAPFHLDTTSHFEVKQKCCPQGLPRLKDLEIVFGHELSDKGISNICNMTGIQRLKLVNFIRLHDCNVEYLTCLAKLEDLVIQVSLTFSLAAYCKARTLVLPSC